MKITLGSQSPRRTELLKGMGINFNIEVREVEETWPDGLQPFEVAMHIAEKKARAFDANDDELIITADTIVCLDGEILGKPRDTVHAHDMLRKLSGRTHQVFTGVCILTGNGLTSFYDETEVKFREVSDREIDYYITNFKPFDKAGSYGVQDWWGLTVVEKMHGSYTNVMGLPTERLYNALYRLGISMPGEAV